MHKILMNDIVQKELSWKQHIAKEGYLPCFICQLKSLTLQRMETKQDKKSKRVVTCRRKVVVLSVISC